MAAIHGKVSSLFGTRCTDPAIVRHHRRGECFFRAGLAVFDDCRNKQLHCVMTMANAPQICDRCSKELVPGTRDFYVVHITAVADPSPPVFTEEELETDPRPEIDRLMRQTSELSEQELLDQIYQRVTIYLCVRCFREWITDPTG